MDFPLNSEGVLKHYGLRKIRHAHVPPCLYAAHGLQEDFPRVGWPRLCVLATAQLGLSALSTPRSCQGRPAGVTGVSECVTRPRLMGG